MEVLLYTNVHKGIRNLVTRFACRAGTVDWTEHDEVAQAGREWEAARAVIDEHHHDEERFIHPLLADGIPGGRRPYDEDHHAIALMMDDLSGHLARLVRDGSVANRSQVGLEFYLGVNRFYGVFLPHLDREETQAQRALNDLYPPEVLAATLQQAIGALSPEVMTLVVDNMFPALSLPEAAALLGSMHLPPETYGRLTARVRQALGEERWARLQALAAVPAS